MWIFTTEGFYSAVADRNDPARILVRSRALIDLKRLLDAIDSGQGVQETKAADYRYRVSLQRAQWVEYVRQASEGIDYPNFKSAVHDTGLERTDRPEEPQALKKRLSAMYSVWHSMRSITP